MDGVIVIDKPKNYTSHDVVNIARKALKTKRIGHTGTLDPNATGVLVLCIGRATKLVKYFEQDQKTYQATFRLGIKTDTDDITGKVIDQGDLSDVNEATIKHAIDGFLGKQLQTPPNYSAVKVNGKKLYELARREIHIPNLKPREVEVFNISNPVIRSDGDTLLVDVEMTVSKGTYIRSIARDLGNQLGCFGTLQDLRRLAVGQFNLTQAVTIEQLKAGEVDITDPFAYLNMQRITVDPKLKHYIANGRFLDHSMFPELTDTIIYSKDGEVLAIYYYDEQKKTMRMSVKWV